MGSTYAKVLKRVEPGEERDNGEEGGEKGAERKRERGSGHSGLELITFVDSPLDEAKFLTRTKN